MEIKDLRLLYAESPRVRAAARALDKEGVSTVYLGGLSAGAVPTVLSALSGLLSATVLLVMRDADGAGYAYNDLCHLLGGERVLFFPSSFKGEDKYDRTDAGAEVLRTETLSRLGGAWPDENVFVVTYPSAVAEMVTKKENISSRMTEVRAGQELDITDFEHRLADLGFTRTDYVYQPGQFAVRGSIVDVYSYSSELPFRLDFFGDEVDSVRTFELSTQLSLEKKDAVRILPSLSGGAEGKIPFPSLLPPGTVIAAPDWDFVLEKIKAACDQKGEIPEGAACNPPFCPPPVFKKEAARFRTVVFGHRDPGGADEALEFSITPQPLFHKNFPLLEETLSGYQSRGYRTYILAESGKQQQRLNEILSARDGGAPSVAPPVPVRGVLHEGFVDNDLKCCFFTDHQIFDRFHKYSLKSDKVRQGKMSLTMKELMEMEVGDYLVHMDFGIGRFGGLVRKPTQKGYKEEIRIIYQRGDIVDISIHSLYKISKYRNGSGTSAPRLSTLGTGAWERLKENAKRHIKDVARDLIKLYARRRREKGFAFSPDSYLQHELEASFLYEDTPDQLRATQEVKADMESDRPMDRLICGDVGFGKTEIAVRAAFKACADGKQVAVLVPTTVLAFQHYQTFGERLKDFPVRVEYLSRARPPKKAREIVGALAAGEVDILIGTHKLINKAVKWHDLGLLVIDEEQKFGVGAKEKLRQLKTNIDTLTMTATPIPRTLQFSLMGARDMSVMRTPPPNRHPISTTVTTFDKRLIAEAVNFEMSRNGQVFFVNDRVGNLPELAAVIKRAVPDCRLAIGHGQMNPAELEKILIGFINYDYDVLLSTTIIENGVDIPNANTIIINDAHHFGLSDLHQMRGRVGRSNRKAFCYLLAPPLSSLPPEACRRLEALETFSDLGSGFALSMQDLDIRGAGNLLGAEQSGFIEDLGYETYQKILSQAVTELRNDEFSGMYAEQIREGGDVRAEDFVDDCVIESDLEMYFPDGYVPGASERVRLYRELDNIQTDGELDAYRKRLVDRFGPVPHEGEELMHVVLLRRYGRRLGCEKIMLRQGLLNMQFVSNPDSAYYQSRTFGNVLDFVSRNARRCQLKEVNSRRLMHVSDVGSVKEAVDILRSIAGK